MAKATEGNMLSCQSDGNNTERHHWVSIFDNAEMTNPGYTRLPSGLVIQFGSIGEWSGSTSDKTAPAFISFKKAFSNRCISATANHMLGYGGASAANWSSIKSCDKNGIQFGITAPGRQWMAIGY